MQRIELVLTADNWTHDLGLCEAINLEEFYK